MKKENISKIYLPKKGGKIKLPYFITSISAGFPSPADDYIDKKLDLNEYLIDNPSATFYVRVDGDSMINAGINSKDILIVDRSKEPKNKKIILAVLNGEFTVKRLIVKGSNSKKKENIMQAFDSINQKWGKNTIKVGANKFDKADWQMKRNYLSKKYTTDWDEILEVKI